MIASVKSWLESVASAIGFWRLFTLREDEREDEKLEEHSDDADDQCLAG